MPELEDLLVDRGALDRQLLAEVLQPFIGIDRDSGEVVPTEGWANLGIAAKVLVFLLARKGMVAMPSVGLTVEGASPREIERSTGVKGGTLRPLLRSMLGDVLVQDSGRRYLVPTHAVLRAKKIIEGGVGHERQGRSPSSTARRRRTRRKRA